MIRQNRKIQFIILITLVCLVSTMTLAYAALSATLSIIGSAEIQNASWNVHFDNIQVNPGSVDISPQIVNNNKITFSADLKNPGEFYKFTVDVVNNGTIDAMIESIIKTPELSTEQKKYLRFEVEYSSGQSISSKQILKAKETKTISVLFSFRNDIPVSDLPTTSTNFDVQIQLIYYQADNTATTIEPGTNNIKFVNGNINKVGSEVCIGQECFYLVDHNDYQAILLSKYNLYVGEITDGNTTTLITNTNGLQNENAKGWFLGYSITNPIIGNSDFSTYSYWSNITGYPSYVYNNKSLVYQYIENYKNYFYTNYDLNVSARLITYEELLKLGCSDIDQNCKNAPAWVSSTTYWTGTAADKDNLYQVGGNRACPKFGACHYLEGYGVRPIIEVPLIEL